MVTGITGSGATTAISYQIGCSSPTCAANTCWGVGVSKIDVQTNVPMCIITSKTKSVGSTAVQMIRITQALTFTASAYLATPAQCMRGNAAETICNSPSFMTSFMTLQSGTCTWYDANIAHVKFVPSTANKLLAFGMVGCNADCSLCTAFAKCQFLDGQYSCVSPNGGLLIKPLYTFPDLSDK